MQKLKIVSMNVSSIKNLKAIMMILKRQILTSAISLALGLTAHAQLYTPSSTIQGASGNNNVGIGILPLYKLHHASFNNTGSASALLWGQYYGTAIGVQSTSSSYYAFSVFNGMNESGGGTPSNLFMVRADGNVGIGTNSPQSKLDVNGPIAVNGVGVITSGGNDVYANLRVIRNTSPTLADGMYIGYMGSGGPLRFFSNSGTTEFMTLTTTGNVGIGTTSPDAKLAVKGTVHAQEVKVDLNVPGPDYVFEKNYNLPSLTETETYIKKNKHLPEVPAAKEMEANGINLSEMNMVLLKKVEELTLHLIEMKKQLDSQDKRIQELTKN